MINIPWKIKGFCINAPATDEVDFFCDFIRNRLAKDGVNTLVLLTRYRFAFKSHPECASDGALSVDNVKTILAVCRECGIELIPKMNLLGHQSGKDRDSLDGLLRAYPEFDETPELDEVFYCRSICVKNPKAQKIVFELMDDMCDAFECSAMHIGCDEVFDIGKCPSCTSSSTAELFAGWVNALTDHLKARGVRTLMWGDRLLNGAETGYGSWEASENGTDKAIATVSKDILICDWHYDSMEKYPSVDIFAKAGFKMLVCPWRYVDNARKFFDYAVSHDHGNIEGIMLTTWYSSRSIIDAINGDDISAEDDSVKDSILNIARTYKTFYMA